MLVSIVIPALNEENYLPKTLSSIQKIEHPDFATEIIVVDGGSTDKTIKLAQEAGARVLALNPDGIGRARQKGLEEARGEIIAFTDADTLVPTHWLTTHLKFLTQPGVAATFGPYKVDAVGGFPLYSYLMNNRILFIKFLPPPMRVLYTPGQNFVFWKEKAQKIGGFDTSLKVMEDVDLALRLRGQGKVLFVENTLVLSSGRRSKEGLGFFFRGIKTSIEYFFFKKREKLETFPHYR